MGFRGAGPQMQMSVPFTPVVKKLMIAHVGIWLIGQVIVEQYFLKEQQLTTFFGLIPELLITKFFVWQPLTYMFLHSTDGITHILFNMLLLWWLGSELEQQWGKRFFTLYYIVCGVGAAVLYTIAILVFSLATEKVQPLFTPVVGASGAIFGLMLAYGIIFGERTVYFFFVFPMKARIFVMILGGIEVVMLLNNGVGGSNVANLAHLGGLITGFLFLITWTRIQRRQSKAGRGKLKLVVNNDKEQPKYWN
ncbi:MAG: rhomboid family intramembrane serine protease [Bdellovibrionales bacterium]